MNLWYECFIKFKQKYKTQIKWWTRINCLLRYWHIVLFSGRVCQYCNGFVKPVTIFWNNAIYHIFQNSFCAHVSRVLTLQSGQQCSTPNLKQKNYASIYSLKVNTVTFLSTTVTVIFLGKKYIRQRQHVDFKYLINSFGWLQSYQSIVIF